MVEIEVAGILFDMDGVLVRSTSGDERCWTRWAERHQLADGFDLRSTHGRRAADTIREHLPHLTDAELRQHLSDLDSFAEEEQSGVTAFPGAGELLSSIPSHRWTIVTSASEKIMRSRLASVGIVSPKSIVGGDSVTRGKPDPEGYLRGAALLTRSPHECLVVEDAPASNRTLLCSGRRSATSPPNGNPVVLGFQGRSQMEKRYGQDAEAMLSQPATKVFFRTSEPRAAKWISEAIGEIEVERLKESRSMGLLRSKKSYAMEIATKPLVMASEIAGLDSHHAYVKQENRVVPVRFRLAKKRKKQPEFIERKRETTAPRKLVEAPLPAPVLASPPSSSPKKAVQAVLPLAAVPAVKREGFTWYSSNEIE